MLMNIICVSSMLFAFTEADFHIGGSIVFANANIYAMILTIDIDIRLVYQREEHNCKLFMKTLDLELTPRIII